MPNYADLDLQTLIDLLVKHTNEHTKLFPFSSYRVEEFTQCKQVLEKIQDAIKLKSGKGIYSLTNIGSDHLPDYIPASIESKTE